MTTQERYEHYVVSKAHKYTQSCIFIDEFYIYLPTWKKDGWGSQYFWRCRNTDLPEDWGMKPHQVEAYSVLGFGDIHSLYILGYIPISLHKLRMQDKNITRGGDRWWCSLECTDRAWYWRPLWGKLTQQRARVMQELCGKIEN